MKVSLEKLPQRMRTMDTLVRIGPHSSMKKVAAACRISAYTISVH